MYGWLYIDESKNFQIKLRPIIIAILFEFKYLLLTSLMEYVEKSLTDSFDEQVL